MAGDRRSWRGRAALLATLLLAGCAHGRMPELAPAEWDTAVRWPPAPEPARIVRVGELRSESDVVGSRGFFGWLADFVLGQAEDVGLVRPVGVAAAGDGRVLVADPGLGAVAVFDTAQGRLRLLWRVPEGTLSSPVGVAADPAGNLYATDSALGVLVSWDAEGRHRWTTAAGELERPTGLAYDPAGDRLLVVDTLAHQVFAYDREGRRQAAFAGRGEADGELNYPVFVSALARGGFVVTDTMNGRVQRFGPDGRPVGTIGRRGDAPGSFSHPKGVAVDGDGHLYVADAHFDNVQIFDPEGRLLLFFGGRDGGGAGLSLPQGIAIDPEGRVFVADSLNGRVQIFRYLSRSAE